jgi:single-strand DNA-binding protein
MNRETGKWEDGTATWYRCNAWGELGEHITETITKGARVIVVGTLEARDWANGDKSGTSWEINVEACGPDLTWATAKVSRAVKAGSGRDVPPPEDPWSTRPAGAVPQQSAPQQQGQPAGAGWGPGYSDEPPF